MNTTCLYHKTGAFAVTLITLAILSHTDLQGAEPNPTLIPLEQLEVTDLGDRVRVELEGWRPPSYTRTRASGAGNRV